MASHQDRHEQEALADTVLSVCGPGRMLDVGCGSGLLVRSLLARGVDALGIDESEAAVAGSGALARKRVQVGSVMQLPFPDGHFDAVTCVDSLDGLAPEALLLALQELHRVVRQDLFIRAAAPRSPDLALRSRADWEALLVRAGFRKHPSYYRLTDFAALDRDDGALILPMEKIPTTSHSVGVRNDGLTAHAPEVDWLREPGRRSDVHLAQYELASRYIRQGDRVLVVNGGRGAGAYLVARLSRAGQVLGIDQDPASVAYAREAFGDLQGRLGFQVAPFPGGLAALPDDSFDCILALQGVAELEEASASTVFHRLLSPGGRLIGAIGAVIQESSQGRPDEAVQAWQGLQGLVFGGFEREALYEQRLGPLDDGFGAGATNDAPVRRLVALEGAQAAPVSFEGLIAVGTKSPFETTPYVEEVFSAEEVAVAGNALAFGRDYEDPWIVRALVSIGMRVTSDDLLSAWAGLAAAAASGSADRGAGLCVSAYRQLEQGDEAALEGVLAEIDQYCEAPPGNPTVLRWQTSLRYVGGLLALEIGDRDLARRHFVQAAEQDVSPYHPSLLTKTLESAWRVAMLDLSDRRPASARRILLQAVGHATRLISRHWTRGADDRSPDFEGRELALAASLVARCISVAKVCASPTAEVRLAVIESQNDLAARLQHERQISRGMSDRIREQDRSAAVLTEHLGALEQGKQWLEGQYEVWRARAQSLEAEALALSAARDEALAGLAAERGMFDSTRRELESKIADLTRESGRLSARVSELESVMRSRRYQALVRLGVLPEV